MFFLQEVQRQQEMMRQQQMMQQHKEQSIQQRESSSASNPATSDSRQTALIQGHPRTSVSTSHSDAKVVGSMDTVLAQQGLQPVYHGADLRRPGSQGIGAFTPPVSGSELSPSVPGAPHIYNAAELQRIGMIRMPLIDPHHLYSAQHSGPHYIPSHIAQHYLQHVQQDSLCLPQNEDMGCHSHLFTPLQEDPCLNQGASMADRKG